MTGFTLGAPDAPERGQRISQNLMQGAIPSRIGRSLLEFEGEQSLGDGVIGKAVGIAAAGGKGVVDSTLGLLRGAEWLGYNLSPAMQAERFAGWKQGKPFFRDMLADEGGNPIPGTVDQLLPAPAQLKLESRLARAGTFGRAAGETAGHLATMVMTGGKGAVSKAVSLPGRAIEALGVPGMKAAESLLKLSPAAGKWAQVAAKHVPGLVGTSTGFGLYNYVTAEGGMEERAAAALHGLVAGAGAHALGALGREIDARIFGHAAPRSRSRTP